MTADQIIGIGFLVLVTSLLLFRVEGIWEIIKVSMDWMMRQIARSFDWFFHRYWS